MRPRDELILNQIKADARLYHGMFLFCLIGVAFAVAISLYALFTSGDLFVLVKAGCMLAAIAAIALSMKHMGDSAAKALKEIGPEAENLDQYHDYSGSTMNALREAQHTRSEYVQLVVSYSILGVMLLGVGILIVVLVPAMDMPYLTIVGAGLAATGVLLCITAVKDFRSLLFLKKIEALENEQ